MTWGSPRASLYVKCVGTVRAASHPPVWIHRKCELRSLKKMLNGLCWDDDYTIAQWLEHRWLQARVPGSSPGGDSQLFLQTFPFVWFLRERDKREKSEEKIDCHDQDSIQGPSLVASHALTTELWCSRHPSRDRSTFSSDFVTHTSCESTQAGGTQPPLYTHTSRTVIAFIILGRTARLPCDVK